MDRIRELSEGSLNILVQNSIAASVLVCLILAFALYIYFFRHTISEYFTNDSKKAIPSSQQQPSHPTV
jgi:hypothetical protein